MNTSAIEVYKADLATDLTNGGRRRIEFRDTQPWDASARCRAGRASRVAARASSATFSLKSRLEEKIEAPPTADGTVGSLLPSRGVPARGAD